MPVHASSGTPRAFTCSGQGRRSRRAAARPRATSLRTVQDAEAAVLGAIQNATGRGKDGISAEQQKVLDDAVAVLESDGGVESPTTSEALDGRWRLVYTSRPGSASPIQRTFTGVEAFKIFQEVLLDGPGECRVNNIVEFGDDARIGVLRVEAQASTDSRPLPGFTPRQGAGWFIFGKSQVGPPAKKNLRIDFQFDRAAFAFRFLPFKVPYPVPFKYLGDETKGWIDITYLNKEGTFRLTRGNKGTLFVLTRSGGTDADVDELLAAIRGKDDARIKKYVARLEGKSAMSAPARDDKIYAKWRLVWSQQSDDANPLQKALVGQVKNWQIIESGEGQQGSLENRVDLGIATVRALAKCEAVSDTRTQVVIEKAFAVAGGRDFSLQNFRRDSEGYVDWLYVDSRVRITKGNRGSLFVHVRDDESS